MLLHRVHDAVRDVCQYVLKSKVLRSLLLLLCIFAYCEIFHYYVVIIQCTWPSPPVSDNTQRDGSSIKVMFLADTHLLGFRNGHWWDKLRREWQMKQSFQTSMLIHKPEVVFVLGDLFDEGKWCNDKEFYNHVSRFRSMFAVPASTRLYVVSGNHDEGFHYMMSDHKHERFENAFESPSVRMLRIEDKVFVLVNSMAMEGDGCSICAKAEDQLSQISYDLIHQQKCEKYSQTPSEDCRNSDESYTQPILLQHFPMYRKSDSICNTEDSAPPEEKNIPFKPRKDCLDQRSSNLLMSSIQPRLIISAHTHHGCYRVHPNGVPEWSVSSFSWRNRNNPTFLLARISNLDHTISKCFLPYESTVIKLYLFGAVLIVVSLLWPTISYTYRQKMY